jgi:hypothetical protein
MINRRPAGSLYIVSQDDLDTIGCLIESLNLAISQIFENRKIHDPMDGEEEECPAVLDFDAQVQLILAEEELKKIR